MTDLKKVKPGDRLRIPAIAYNAFIDAANDYQRRRHGQATTPGNPARQLCIVPVKNASGSDVGRFGVLGIDGPVFTPDDNLDSFRNHIALVGVTPTTGHAGRFAILLEPVASGSIGQAAVAGVCVAKVDVQSASDRFADVNDGDISCLKSGSFGSATILWKEFGAGLVWAVVRIGQPGIPPPPDEGSYVLGAVDGELVWVETTDECPEPG